MNHIEAYIHCKKCLEEMPAGQSPRSFQRMEAGWTIKGLQIICKRHNANIIHIDFEGQKHKADIGETGDAIYSEDNE